MKDVQNRVPRYPNRVKITPENGTPFYATWERADEPIQEGTSIDRALFLSIKEGDWYSPGLDEMEAEAGTLPAGEGIVDCSFCSPFSGPPLVLVWQGAALLEPQNVTAFGFQAQAGACYLAIRFTGREVPA